MNLSEFLFYSALIVFHWVLSIPGGIFGTPVGLDPDFQSQRTRTLGLTRYKNKGSNWLSTEGKLRPQSLKWTGFLVGESPDHAFWDVVHLSMPYTSKLSTCMTDEIAVLWLLHSNEAERISLDMITTHILQLVVCSNVFYKDFLLFAVTRNKWIWN